MKTCSFNMYTKAHTSIIKQKFWTSFGIYMSPVPSASLKKVNWINYKTGIRGISFKMDVDNDTANVFVEIFLKDTMLQHQYFKIFSNFAPKLNNSVGNEWLFQRDFIQENNRSVSIVKAELKNINVFKESDWPTAISFLKQQMISLDEFWAAYKPAFELI